MIDSMSSVTPNALAYIQEEVRRQGHDIADPYDGLMRVVWMVDAWRWAKERRNGIAGKRSPGLSDIAYIGKLVERTKNVGGLRRGGVRVGTRACPHPDLVPRLLTNLVEDGTGRLSVIEWYKEFELIHPFADGNGRTGKVLMAWLANTFDDPFFPPADLWGEEIANP